MTLCLTQYCSLISQPILACCTSLERAHYALSFFKIIFLKNYEQISKNHEIRAKMSPNCFCSKMYPLEKSLVFVCIHFILGTSLSHNVPRMMYCLWIFSNQMEKTFPSRVFQISPKLGSISINSKMYPFEKSLVFVHIHFILGTNLSHNVPRIMYCLWIFSNQRGKTFPCRVYQISPKLGSDCGSSTFAKVVITPWVFELQSSACIH